MLYKKHHHRKYFFQDKIIKSYFTEFVARAKDLILSIKLRTPARVFRESDALNGINKQENNPKKFKYKILIFAFSFCKNITTS